MHRHSTSPTQPCTTVLLYDMGHIEYSKNSLQDVTHNNTKGPLCQSSPKLLCLTVYPKNLTIEKQRSRRSIYGI